MSVHRAPLLQCFVEESGQPGVGFVPSSVAFISTLLLFKVKLLSVVFHLSYETAQAGSVPAIPCASTHIPDNVLSDFTLHCLAWVHLSYR